MDAPHTDPGPALAAPFPADALGWKPQSVKGNRALAVPYIDARDVMQRLDAVLGVAGWQDEYTPLPDGSAVCRLRLKFGGEWVTKEDVGSPSEQPDAGDRLKASYSDALKRAAVKWGVGRYLYSLPATWCDYDAVKKQFTAVPQLPAWALPKGETKPAPAPAPAPDSGKFPALPKDGRELADRLAARDRLLAESGVCRAGALVAHVTAAGVKAGYSPDVAGWGGAAIPFAVAAVKAFEAAARSKPAAAGEGRAA